MITAAQLRKAARLIDRGWAQGHYEIGKRFCPYGAALKVRGLTSGSNRPSSGLSPFEISVAWHNDAPDCTKDGAVMFLLVCAEAREHGDL